MAMTRTRFLCATFYCTVRASAQRDEPLAFDVSIAAGRWAVQSRGIGKRGKCGGEVNFETF